MSFDMGCSGSCVAKAHSCVITVNLLFPWCQNTTSRTPCLWAARGGVGNRVGALDQAVASCFTDCVCSFALLSGWELLPSGLIGRMDDWDLRGRGVAKGMGV